MKELQVGEYVRINNNFRVIALGIGKVIRINQDTIYIKMNFESPFAFKIENIAKHSFNIIDLIEDGDYVNGYYVRATYLEGPIKYIKLDNNSGIRTYEEDIKSILTHEQFEANEYKTT